MLDQRCGGEIPEDLGPRHDPLRVKAATRNPLRHWQAFLSQYVKNGGGRCLACRRIRMREAAYRHDSVAGSKRSGGGSALRIEG
jgi:hypothetical protein